jgi:hypothetical protein
VTWVEHAGDVTVRYDPLRDELRYVLTVRPIDARSTRRRWDVALVRSGRNGGSRVLAEGAETNCAKACHAAEKAVETLAALRGTSGGSSAVSRGRRVPEAMEPSTPSPAVSRGYRFRSLTSACQLQLIAMGDLPVSVEPNWVASLVRPQDKKRPGRSPPGGATRSPGPSLHHSLTFLERRGFQGEDVLKRRAVNRASPLFRCRSRSVLNVLIPVSRTRSSVLVPVRRDRSMSTGL